MSDRIVCDCMGTSFEDIKKAVEDGAKTLDVIKETTEAGTICCGCDCEIEEALNEIVK
ncbi:MAG: (2Fe-2S)-binding protein [Terrisporobacter sp.]|uniref:(2Fe-2S)-binding protein n=1 Tax=Terrisporobacter sp. TaxID=1965305 RepID=UPI002FC88717